MKNQKNENLCDQIKKRQSQNQLIFERLLRGLKINAKQAMALGIWRLSGRIHDLRKDLGQDVILTDMTNGFATYYMSMKFRGEAIAKLRKEKREGVANELA